MSKINSNKYLVGFVCKIRNHFNGVELINAFRVDSDSLTNKIIKFNCLSFDFLYAFAEWDRELIIIMCLKKFGLSAEKSYLKRGLTGVFETNVD